MMKINKIIMNAILCMNVSVAFACVRVDLPDRPPTEVVGRSIHFGKTMNESQTTVAVWIDNKELSSGIALDPYTVLTCAHGLLQESSFVNVKLAPNAQRDPVPGEYRIAMSAKYIHPTFEFVGEFHAAIHSQRDGSGLSTKGIRFRDLKELTFECFIKTTEIEGEQYKEFKGVDLAILKLFTPLPADLPYLSFYGGADPLIDVNAVSLGFGALKFNSQQGPVATTTDQEKLYYRHLLSTKVYSGAVDADEVSVLYGKYKGILGNGDESFIPDAEMGKMVGLPTGGDSGGPLVIDGKLAGILSATIAPLNNHVEGDAARSQLTDYVQPIFPIWTDLRPHLEWIRSYMGPVG